MHSLHQGLDGTTLGPLLTQWMACTLLQGRKYLPNKVSQATFQHPASSLQFMLHTVAMQSGLQYTSTYLSAHKPSYDQKLKAVGLAFKPLPLL